MHRRIEARASQVIWPWRCCPHHRRACGCEAGRRRLRRMCMLLRLLRPLRAGLTRRSAALLHLVCHLSIILLLRSKRKEGSERERKEGTWRDNVGMLALTQLL